MRAKRSNLDAGLLGSKRLVCARLLQAFYSLRSEQQLVERTDHDLLLRWFVGLGLEDPVWDATPFAQNRDRLLEGDLAAQFLAAVLAQDKVKSAPSSALCQVASAASVLACNSSS